MNPVVMTLSTLLLLVTGSQLGLGAGLKSTSESGDTVYLGVYVVYDQAFQDSSKFRDPDGRYLKYFTVFLNTVEAWFRELEKPRVKLTLQAAIEEPESGIDESDDPSGEDEEYESHKNTDDAKTSERPCRKGAVTMSKFKTHVEEQKEVYMGADVVFFVTGICVNLTIGTDGKLEGLPEPGKVCERSVGGVVYDDGNTFRGAKTMALLIARMLGAKNGATSGCDLLPNLTGETLSGLPPCIKQSLSKFQETPGHSCLQDIPTPATHNTNMLPNQYYEKKSTDKCLAASSGSQDNKTCRKNNDQPNGNECNIMCSCNDTTTQHKFRTNAADGTPCTSGKMCLFGTCVTK